MMSSTTGYLSGTSRQTEMPVCYAACIYCHKKFMSNAACVDGHYVCDTCHSKKGIEAVKEICLHSKSKNPYEIAVKMMENPFIHMHGPENHVLVGAALLATIQMELPDEIICTFTSKNHQCIGKRCPFNAVNHKKGTVGFRLQSDKEAFGGYSG